MKHKHKFKVIRTMWPHPVGYGTFCRGCGTLLDSGLTKEAAMTKVEELNRINKGKISCNEK